MRTVLLLLIASCGGAPGGQVTVHLPIDRVGGGFLHAAVFDGGACSTLATPVDLSTALVSLTQAATFDGAGNHPMTLEGIPAGSGRMIVVVIEENGDQVCRACTDGVSIEDGVTSTATLILLGCP